MTPVVGLAAVVAVVFDRFAEFVFGVGDASLATIAVIRGLRAGSARKEKEPT